MAFAILVIIELNAHDGIHICHISMTRAGTRDTGQGKAGDVVKVDFLNWEIRRIVGPPVEED